MEKLLLTLALIVTYIGFPKSPCDPAQRELPVGQINRPYVFPAFVIKRNHVYIFDA